ncbi:MAG: hypothetical protein AB7V00_03065 [Bacilli bacterium]
MLLKNMIRIKAIFERINYYPKINFDFADYEDLFLRQITKCTNVQDVNLLILDYLFVIKKHRKIMQFLSSKNKWKYDQIDIDPIDKIEYFTDDMCFGNNVFTTVLSKNHNKIHHVCFDDKEIYQVKKKKNSFTVYENNEYFLNHKNNKIRIEKDKKLKLKFVMNNDLDIIIKENNVGYEIVKKGSLYTINNVFLEEDDKLQATIDCDIPKENQTNASALVEVYEEDDELLLLIGIGILLLIQDQMKRINNRLKLLMAITLLNNRRKH